MPNENGLRIGVSIVAAFDELSSVRQTTYGGSDEKDNTGNTVFGYSLRNRQLDARLRI